MSETSVRPMRADEYDGWRARSESAYAQDMIQSGRIEPAAASQKATNDFATFLPDGLETKGQSVYALEGADGVVGSLWLGERENEQGPELFVYEVYIDAEARGQGHGRDAMRFAEEEAGRRGIAAISLNVFGGNDVARGLYRSLGYDEVAVFMRKRL